MSPLQTSTPLLGDKSTNLYGYDGNIGTVSTEDVVNVVGNNPSLSFVMVILGIFTFNLVLPSAAYFPNFGGYVPYNEWKCSNSSEECFDRTQVIYESGWTKVPTKNEEIALEYRCSLDLRGFNFNDTSEDIPTIQIFRSSHETLGFLQFDLNRKDQQIKLVSSVNCENGETSCQKVFSVNFGQNFESLDCLVDFGHTSWVSKNASITCNSVTVYLEDEFGIIPVIEKMDLMQLHDIDRYNLICPDSDQYNRASLCGAGQHDTQEKKGELDVHNDFHWNKGDKNSFSIQWDLYCGREYLQTMVGSVYFVGGLVGAFVGGVLFDLIGRKKGSLIGYLTVIVATFATAASPYIGFLFVGRFLQGVGSGITIPGLTILSLEYVPQKYRAASNSTLQVFWSCGYLIATLTGYLIKDWHWLAATSGFLFTVSLIPLLLVPESPRFLLVNKNDEKGAKKSLRWLIWLNGSDYDIDNVALEGAVAKDESKDESFMENIRDIWKYKALLVQFLIQMWVWMVGGFLYYGFSFSWSSLGKNMYYSYLFAALAELVAYLILTFPLDYWGRKATNIFCLLVASVSCLVAIVPYNISDTFTLEQLCCLVSSMLMAASFGSLYLYTMELSPTSHRGKILGWCSLLCKVASSLGPQASLLFNWNRVGALTIFAVLAGSAGLAVFGLPDTTGIPTPNTAKEVQLRRDKRRMDSVEKKQQIRKMPV